MCLPSNVDAGVVARPPAFPAKYSKGRSAVAHGPLLPLAALLTISSILHPLFRPQSGGVTMQQHARTESCRRPGTTHDTTWASTGIAHMASCRAAGLARYCSLTSFAGRGVAAAAAAAGCLSTADRFGVVSGPRGSYLGERERRDRRSLDGRRDMARCRTRIGAAEGLTGGHHGSPRSLKIFSSANPLQRKRGSCLAPPFHTALRPHTATYINTHLRAKTSK